MNIIEFLSDRTYVLLPSKTNPKVYIPLDTKFCVKESFKLYNPFSWKGKCLKTVAKLCCTHAPFLARSIFPIVHGRLSDFLLFIEKKLQKKILTSVYIATAKDKVVLQLQDANGIIGYLKFPITKTGEKRLINEKYGIETLKSLRRVPNLILSGLYEDTPFIVVENMEGSIGAVSQSDVKEILNSFEKNNRHPLSAHPRVLLLRNKLKNNGEFKIRKLLGEIVSKSKNSYLEVFEHGDFAAWNIIRTEEGDIPFDFEYFEENGLQYLDELKFYFQELSLLHKLNGENLITSLASRVKIDEFDLIFRIFLIKEIANKDADNESFEDEMFLLLIMNTLKPMY